LRNYLFAQFAAYVRNWYIFAMNPTAHHIISLRRGLDASSLVNDNPCSGVSALGSYWSGYGDTDTQSRLVRFFKDNAAEGSRSPYFMPVASTYADMIARIASVFRPSALVRVLASSETMPDHSRPLAALADMVCMRLNIPDFTHLFFRSEKRKPMSQIDILSGAGALRRRIEYVKQDVFIREHSLGGRVLLIDDICNLKATARVYSAALKSFCGVEYVSAVYLAAARFNNGKDGWGYLSLDLDEFARAAKSSSAAPEVRLGLEDVWLAPREQVFHSVPNCRLASPDCRQSFRFLAEQTRSLCSACAAG